MDVSSPPGLPRHVYLSACFYGWRSKVEVSLHMFGPKQEGRLFLCVTTVISGWRHTCSARLGGLESWCRLMDAQNSHDQLSRHFYSFSPHHQGGEKPFRPPPRVQAGSQPPNIWIISCLSALYVWFPLCHCSFVSFAANQNYQNKSVAVHLIINNPTRYCDFPALAPSWTQEPSLWWDGRPHTASAKLSFKKLQ